MKVILNWSFRTTGVRRAMDLSTTTNLAAAITPNKEQTKFEMPGMVTSLLNMTNRVTYEKYVNRLPYVVVVLILRMFYFRVKHFLKWGGGVRFVGVTIYDA